MPPPRAIVGVCGWNGSGKSTVCAFFERLGFRRVSLSDEIRAELARRNEPESRDALVQLGNELRLQYGHGVLAQRCVARMSTASREAPLLVVDSVRHPAEVAELRRSVPPGRCVMLAVYSAAAERQARAVTRARPGDAVDAVAFAQADAREAAAATPADAHTQQLDAVLALCDMRIDNNSTIDALHAALQSMWQGDAGLAAQLGVAV